MPYKNPKDRKKQKPDKKGTKLLKPAWSGNAPDVRWIEPAKTQTKTEWLTSAKVKTLAIKRC